ncbi:uncharacterized protein LOC110826304 [Carica papaya]|uniref:uncharacterized protein LOC110826304 n=1 Tax=Carica papaya TaxID=3649 RepID=UPI000B8C6FC2|nr:uncharacterized protein LOC110826304 [Carica papaya]
MIFLTSSLQVEENNRLRSELQKKIQELEKFKLDEPIARRPNHFDKQNEHVCLPYEVHQAVPSLSSQHDKIKNMGSTPTTDSLQTLVVRQDMNLSDDAAAVQNHSESHSGSGKVNGASKATVDSASLFHLSSPSTTAFSPTRHQIEGEYDQRYNSSGHGLMPMAEVNNTSSIWKQDLILKIREHEEEIMQLRKHLADYSIKEAQIRNEKYVLEKRISYMRLAFDHSTDLNGETHAHFFCIVIWVVVCGQGYWACLGSLVLLATRWIALFALIFKDRSEEGGKTTLESGHFCRIVEYSVGKKLKNIQ